MNLTEEELNNMTGQVAAALRGSIDFSMYLKMARVAKDMSRLELAAKASTSRSTLSKLENGKRSPSPKVLGGLVSALEMNADQQAYFLSLAAEAQIKFTDKSKCVQTVSQPYKRAVDAPMTEKEKAALEQITGKKW